MERGALLARNTPPMAVQRALAVCVLSVMARLRTVSETVLYIQPQTQKSACLQTSSVGRGVEAVAR
jgi:hypothetical protein